MSGAQNSGDAPVVEFIDAAEAGLEPTIEGRAMHNAGSSLRHSHSSRSIFDDAEGFPSADALSPEDASAPVVLQAEPAVPTVAEVSARVAVVGVEKDDKGNTGNFFSRIDRAKLLLRISLTVEVVVRIAAFPIFAIRESFASQLVPPLGSVSTFSASVVSMAAWVSLAIVMIATDADPATGRRTTSQKIAHGVVCGVIACCNIWLFWAVLRRRYCDPRSYVIENAERLAAWPFMLLVWARVAFEGAQLAVFPLLFVPLAASRGGNDASRVGLLADAEGLRYRTVNEILLRAFPRNQTWWSSLNNETALTPRDTAAEATFDLYWPLAVLCAWMVVLSLNGMLVRQRGYIRCPSMGSQTLAGRRRSSAQSLFWFADTFYTVLLLLEHVIFDLSGPLAIMLLSAGTQFLVLGFDRQPSAGGLSAKAYQGLGVWFGLTTMSTLYVQPRVVACDATSSDIIESPLHNTVRGFVKVMFVCGSITIGLAGTMDESAAESSAATRATIIAVFAIVVHLVLALLSTALRPYPRDGINVTLLMAHGTGVLVAVVVLVLTHAASPRGAAEGAGGLLILCLVLVCLAIVAFAVYHCRLRRTLPDDEVTFDARDRSAIVSGLRLFSATISGECAVASRAAITQLLWRPMEPLLVACGQRDHPNRQFVLRLLQASFLPANVEAPMPWVISAAIAIQHLLPAMPQETLMHALQFTTHFVAHYAPSRRSATSTTLAAAAFARVQILEKLDESSWNILLRQRAIAIPGESGELDLPLIAAFPTIFIGCSHRQLDRVEAFCALATALRIEAEALHHFVASNQASVALPRDLVSTLIGHFHDALETCAKAFLANSEAIFSATIVSKHSKKCLVCIREAWLDAYACVHGCDTRRRIDGRSHATRTILREYNKWKEGSL